MKAEEVMKLFDSCWFGLENFKKHLHHHHHQQQQEQQASSSNSETNPDREIQEQSPKPEFSRINTLHRRSMSDQLSLRGSCLSDSLSPKSVLFSPKLDTILSGKEISRETNRGAQKSPSSTKKVVADRRRSRTKKGATKSFSDLEFEELKGFMDLGFVFSEEDRDSSLVSIIPGLQRLGKKIDGEEEEDHHDDDGKKSGSGNVDESAAVSRPYLSEAWGEDLDKRKREKKKQQQQQQPLMNWRVPSMRNEIGMKDSLRSWAHTVALLLDDDDD